VFFDEKPAELLYLTVVLEESRQMRLWLHTVLNVVIVPHQILRQENAWIEPSTDFWVDIIYMEFIDTFVVHEKLHLRVGNNLSTRYKSL
jgi:hypothetical protein